MKRFFGCLVFIGLTIGAYAQSTSVSGGVKDTDLETFASLFGVEQAPFYSEVGFSLAGFDGMFNRPQMPASATLGTFTAKSRQQQGNLIWKGHFDWTFQQDENQRWNNTSRHPDALPYIWADEATGRWDRNHFNALVQVGNIPKGNFSWGAGLYFQGGQGDRLNDPKPLYRFRTIGLQPEVALRIKGNQWLGVKLLYESFSEDNEMGYFSIDDPLLFRLRGYGTYSRTPFVSGERQLSSNRLGGAIRWIGPKKWVIQSGASFTTGESQEGISILTNGGSWQTTHADISIQKSWTKFWHHALYFTGSYRQTDGTDPNFGAVNTKLRTSSAKIRWLLSKQDSSNHWQLGLETGLQDRQQEDLASFTEAAVQSLLLQIHAGIQKHYNKWHPFLGLLGSFEPNINNLFSTQNTSVITDELLRPDFQILSAGFFTAGIKAGVDFKHRNDAFRLVALYHRVQTYNTTEPLHQNRFSISLSYAPGQQFQATSPMSFSTF